MLVISLPMTRRIGAFGWPTANQYQVVPVHQRVRTPQQVTNLCPQGTIGMPALVDPVCPKERDRNLALGRAGTNAIKRLQRAHMRNGSSQRGFAEWSRLRRNAPAKGDIAIDHCAPGSGCVGVHSNDEGVRIAVTQVRWNYDARRVATYRGVQNNSPFVIEKRRLTSYVPDTEHCGAERRGNIPHKAYVGALMHAPPRPCISSIEFWILEGVETPGRG